MRLSESVHSGGYRKIPDVDVLVSKIRARADNAICFVLGNFSLAKRTLFHFNHTNESFNIELVLLDPNIFTWRTIIIHKLSIQGDRFLMKENLWVTYNLDLSQDVFVEKDPTKNCTVYPNKDDKSYGECDQANTVNMIHGIVPIWNTNSISSATRNSSITEEEKHLLCELAEGLVDSPCNLPCTSTKATAQFAMGANEPQLMASGIRVAEKCGSHLLYPGYPHA